MTCEQREIKCSERARDLSAKRTIFNMLKNALTGMKVNEIGNY